MSLFINHLLFFITLISLNIFFLFFYEKLASKVNLYDLPDQIRKFHKNKTPLLGGLIIYTNITLIMFFNFFLDDILTYKFNLNNNLEIIIFFISSSALFAVGFLDDKYDLKISIRLFLYSLIIFFTLFFDNSLIVKDLNFSFLRDEIYLGNLAIPITLLCFIMLINALNMFDGINLQLVIYIINILFFLLVYSSYHLYIIGIITPLVLILYLNYKSKIFLGDNGSVLLAFIIGYLFIKNYNSTNFLLFSNNNIFADQIVLILLLPGLDMIRLFALRILNNKNPFLPDRQHIHYLLFDKIGLVKTTIIIQILLIMPLLLISLSFNTISILTIIMIVYFLLLKNSFKNNV